MYRGLSIYGEHSLLLESPEIIGGPYADHDVLQDANDNGRNTMNLKPKFSQSLHQHVFWTMCKFRWDRQSSSLKIRHMMHFAIFMYQIRGVILVFPFPEKWFRFRDELRTSYRVREFRSQATEKIHWNPLISPEFVFVFGNDKDRPNCVSFE